MIFPILLSAGDIADDAPCLDRAQRAALVTLHPRGSKLTAIISPDRGGELVGLFVERAGQTRQLLYRGMDFCPVKGFDGKAPILWPATGRNYAIEPVDTRSDAAVGWQWHGRRYPMPIHGFAKDSVWRVVRTGHGRVADSVTLRLDETSASLAQHPFRFSFTITYRLVGATLTIDHRITAGRNAAPMPFSIGNHITFAVPLAGMGTIAGTTISTAAAARVTLDGFGRPTGRMPQVPLVDVPITTLGKEVALPLAGYRKGPVRATIRQAGAGAITITQDGSRRTNADPVRFNLWGNANSGFFSVEPWLGLQNALASGQGVVRLVPSTSFRWTVAVKVDL